MSKHIELGRHGEELAASFLENAGYRIVDRNWRCSAGELDIIAIHQDTLVAVEVKTRSSTAFGAPIQAITPQKAVRLRKVFYEWLRHKEARGPLRVDAVSVLRQPDGAFTIDHVQGVA